MPQMLVETFEQTEETATGKDSCLDEKAAELIEKLGLEGQKALASPKNSDVRCPYREMSIEELCVYTALFPEKIEIKHYDRGFIPVRVLQVAAHADNIGTYGQIQIWCERTMPRDPLLVGRIGTSDWNAKYHILARWGDALESFEVLKERAKKIMAEEIKNKLSEARAEFEQAAANVDGIVFKKLRGQQVHISFSV